MSKRMLVYLETCVPMDVEDDESWEDIVEQAAVSLHNQLSHHNRPVTELSWRLEQEEDDTKGNDPWQGDPDYPVSDWQSDVANNDTRLGYLDWVEHNRESAQDDETATPPADSDE
jgi:hypothetical protein